MLKLYIIYNYYKFIINYNKILSKNIKSYFAYY